MPNNIFQKVPIPKVRRSYFNNSHEVKFDCDMGQIIPFCCKIMNPSEYWKISNEIVVRVQPLAAPILHQVDVQTYYFVAPLRCLFGEMVDAGQKHSAVDPDFDPYLDDEWKIDDHAFETFMTRGVMGTDTSVALPRWIPTGNAIVNDNDNGDNTSDVNVTTTDNGIYSLWDYLGFPVGVIPAGAYPVDFPRRMYNWVYNEYFRDQTIMPPVDVAGNSKVLQACWKKDYFTSSLPFTQRGPDVQLPVDLSGFLPVHFSLNEDGTAIGNFNIYTETHDTSFNLVSFPGGGAAPQRTKSVSGSVDSSGISGYSVTVNDLRLAISLQHFLEKNAIGGSRYNEFLKAHFGIAPRDDRLQRPQFIGGSKSPIIISEVLQTSQTTSGESGSPQGNLAGHGLTASKDYICSYHCLEYSILLGVMVIRPKSSYQQGISKEFLMRDRYDFYLPSLSGLGQNIIEEAEIYAQNSGNVDDSGNPFIFGYTGRYNEYRYTPSRVAGGLRSTFDYWHLGRVFGSAPSLNPSFLKCIPSKRIFLVQDEPGFIVDVGNILHTWRPMPHFATPGLRRV